MPLIYEDPDDFAELVFFLPRESIYVSDVSLSICISTNWYISVSGKRDIWTPGFIVSTVSLCNMSLNMEQTLCSTAALGGFYHALQLYVC